MSLDTRGIDPRRLLPQSLEDRLLGWLGRFGGLILLSLILLTWASLVSWSVWDPSLTHATGAAPRNVTGAVGAIFADLLFQTLGYAAAIALVAPLVWSFDMLRSERVPGGRTKLGFYPLSVLACAGALSSLPTYEGWPLRHGYGGLLGDGLLNLACKLFGLINHDRAPLAAGVLLFAAAIQTAGKAIGFEPETVGKNAIRAISNALSAIAAKTKRQPDEPKDGATEEPQDEAPWGARYNPNPESEARERHRARNPFLDDAPEPEATTEDEPIDAPAASLSPLAPAPALAQARIVEPERQPKSASFSAAAIEAMASGRVPESFATESAPFAHHELSVPPGVRFGPPRQSPALSSEDDIDNRGIEFDDHTDEASRAIAARFAPQSREAGKIEVNLKQSPPAKAGNASKGILGGLARGRAGVQWRRPSLHLLKRPSASKARPELAQTVLRGTARLLEDVLGDFGVKGQVKDIKPGPVVTLFEMEPSRGTKSSRVIGLAEDIARSMSVSSVRAAVVPGRNAIGLELPNARREPVLLREILESEAFKATAATLPLALGKSIGGEPIVADLARMPHLLIAGTTGSGKSVGINAMIVSLLYRHAPEDCRMLMIDPKMLELSVYNGVPHLLTPVVTDPLKAVAALNWAVREMEERYKQMAALSVRGIDVFNNRVRNARKRGELLSRTVQTGFDKAGQARFETQRINLEPLPHIVVVVDEFADLMIAAGKDVESAVQRLAQMARAAGIHLIMATQRPSVDVITGTIKANFPVRISFKVTSKIDSRTILNEQGAEQLLGQGDMLYSTGGGQVMRVHGGYVSDEEVQAVVEDLRSQGAPAYVDGITDAPLEDIPVAGVRDGGEEDLYSRAVATVLRDQKASTSYIQRRLSIGYNRAADLIERMEREGLISPANSVGKREILVTNADAPDTM